MSRVSLIGMTSPSIVTGCNSASQLVAYTARVSNPENQENHKSSSKLLRYLIKNKHWSPFEMVHITMEIVTTRDIARQILRHRSFSFQEFSQRYAVQETFEYKQARMQDSKNRQNSIELEDSDAWLEEDWSMQQAKVLRAAKDAYNWALENGIAKEQARAVLPEGNTQSTLYMAGSLRSWIHYCELRRGHGTQKEHREVADKCWEIITGYYPDIAEALS